MKRSPEKGYEMNIFELLIALAITAGATAGMLSMASQVEVELIPAYEQHYKQFEKFKNHR